MKHVIGIIAEYNPFHNGHHWQIKQCKKMFGDVPVIAVMSGHFTQRGYPAILDKWKRAQMAVYGGVDLVLELPFLAACKSAQFFATRALEILNSTNIVSHLCFGAECADIKTLQQLSEISQSENFSIQLKTQLESGISYAAAIGNVFKNLMPSTPETIMQPNNILAIEYLKVLSATKFNIQPVALQRKDAGYLDREIKGNIASASAIREYLFGKELSQKVLSTLPEKSAEILLRTIGEKNLLNDSASFEKLIFYRLRQLESTQILQIADISEGLENLFKKAAHNSSSLSQLIEQTVSKRYAKTRITRAFCQLLVLNNGDEKLSFSPYMRILAFNEQGRNLIRNMHSKAAAPVITNLPNFYHKCTEESIKNSLKIDNRATDIYQLLLGKNQSGLDFRQTPVYVRK